MGSRIYHQSQAQCAVYKINLEVYNHPPLHADFINGVQSLPAEYNEEEYMNFLRNFGTHYVQRMTLGGRWGWQSEFKYDDFQRLLNERIDVKAGLEQAGQIKSGTEKTRNDTQVYRVTKAIYKNSSFDIGGDFQPNLEDWVESVRGNPQPISLTLGEVKDIMTPKYFGSNIADLDKKRANFINASLNGYCPYLVRSLGRENICGSDQPIPMPTPSPLTKNAIQRVCIKNMGGYAMYWTFFKPGSQHEFKSTTFFTGMEK